MRCSSLPSRLLVTCALSIGFISTQTFVEAQGDIDLLLGTPNLDTEHQSSNEYASSSVSSSLSSGPTRIGTYDDVFVSATSSSLLASETSSMVMPATHDHDHDHDHAKEHGGHAEAAKGGHVHLDSHVRPMEYINETYILLTHDPDPPSYMDLDIREEDGANGHLGLLILHVLFSTLAFFGAYPAALFLKAGDSALAPVVNTVFLILGGLGVFFGFVYSRASEDRYVGDAHPKLAYITVLIVLCFNFVDIINFTRNVAAKWRAGELSFSRECLYSLMSNAKTSIHRTAEHLPLHQIDSDDEADDIQPRTNNRHQMHNMHHDLDTWEPGHAPSPSTSSQTTMDPISSPIQTSEVHHKASTESNPSSSFTVGNVLHISRVIIERGLVFFVWFVFLSGIASWVGWCRGHYVNGCAAHSIKGSIFMWYGMLSFSRYIGAFSNIGWAWNQHPRHSKTAWSAEFVECLVICLYGASNTWLERLGKTGAYGPKDIQHISIAVMFWFAGLLGMFLESKSFRKLLAFPAAEETVGTVTPPPSYGFSFNPFPALCIGVTGIAMAAHNQAFQFQIQIHMLWGWLLSAFAVCRILTYFFLYLRPPTSTLPSRPPTEALATFFLTCGGIMFILSIEQINFAAMRHHFDDTMGFLNVGIAFTCIILVWITALFVMKGSALRKAHSLTSHINFLPKTYEN